MTVIGVLGAVRVRDHDGREVALGSRRQRRMLAALAWGGGGAVAVDVLLELVWGGEPAQQPRARSAAVHTVVARLRTALPGGVRVETSPAGYRLVAGPGAVDAEMFGEYLAAAARSDQATDRLDTLRLALALWRGPPYAELDHPLVAPEVARLTELRTAAVEQLAETLLAAARPGEAVAELEGLVGAEPLREGAVALLMRALAGAGRVGDALGAYARLRSALAEQLGLDPSPPLRRLHEQLLRHELEPPLPAGSPSRPRLPVSSFVGRQAELDTVAAALAGHRLVTLCGPGGVGKSRLALHAAARVADDYPDGVVVVALAAARTEDLVVALAAALGIPDAAGAAPATRIVDVLAVRRQLIVLDNCEHLLGPAAELVEAITTGSDRVDVLATSREPLRADGEQVLRIGPLPVEAATVLLADRITAADRAAAPAETDRPLLADVVRRLDALPLACELAAARVPALGLTGLLAALDEPFAVLGGGRRTAAARHRSLRDVVAWSVDLLTGPERELFGALSVFAGPVEAGAVAVVCPHPDRLADLVDRSLVLRVAGEPARYGMLETLRAYGRAHLGGADPRLRARHARWAVGFATATAAGRRGPGEPAAIARFDGHVPDIRRAHASLLETGGVAEVLVLGVVIAELAQFRGRAELVALVERTLTAVAEPDVSGRERSLLARLLGLAAQLSWQRGDLAETEQRCRRAVRLADRAGDPAAARDAHESWGNMHQLRGEWDDARRHLHRALALARAADDPFTAGSALVDLVLTEAYAGDTAAAADHERALARLAHDIGAPTVLAAAAYAAGERRAESDPGGAAPYLRAAVEHAESADLTMIAGYARHTLLTSAARSAQPAAALAVFVPLIDHWHRLGAWGPLWLAIRAMAETLSRDGRHHDAVRLLSAHHASPRAAPPAGADADRLAAVVAAARVALGVDYPRAEREGRRLGDEQAVDLARRLATDAPGPDPAVTPAVVAASSRP